MECIFVMNQLRQFLRREKSYCYEKDCRYGRNAKEERPKDQGNGHSCADAVCRYVVQCTKQGCEWGPSGFSNAGSAFH